MYASICIWVYIKICDREDDYDYGMMMMVFLFFHDMPTGLNYYAKVGKEKRNLAEGPKNLIKGTLPLQAV